MSEQRKSVTLSNLAPGQMPAESDLKQTFKDSDAAMPSDQYFKEMRLATRKEVRKRSFASKCWTGFWCLVPDVMEDAGGMAARGAMKGVVNGVSLVGAAASLNIPKVKEELKAIFSSTMPTDLEKYEYNPITGKLPGRLTAREMIYCARLSLLSYLTRDVEYDKFLPEKREDEIFNPLFDEEAVGEIHRVFFVKSVASLFETERKLPDGQDNKRFGYSKGIADGLDMMNLEQVYLFDINDNEGFIAKSKDFDKNGGDVVIAFQGTVERKDFITAFRGLSTPFEPLFDRNNAGTCSCLQGRALGCCLGESAALKEARANNKPFGRVHVGFYEAFLSLRPTIQANLEVLFRTVVPDKKPVRIVITGHSLGGALAALCTAWIMQWFRYVFPGGLPDTFRVLSITFGQPKVGDKDFVHAIDKDEWTNWSAEKNAMFKTYRIFTPIDPVITTPPVAMGYMHCYGMCLIKAGHMYFLPQSMANKVDTTAEGLRRAIDNGASVLSFHDIFAYLDAVLHFADLYRDDQDIEQVFGCVDFQADVLQPGFLEKF